MTKVIISATGFVLAVHLVLIENFVLPIPKLMGHERSLTKQSACTSSNKTNLRIHSRPVGPQLPPTASLQENSSITTPDVEENTNTNSQQPPTSRYTYYDDVMLLGQFNYDSDPKYIVHWHVRWSEIFRHIQVRGPFSNTTLAALRAHDIAAFWGEDDKGAYSPMKNLAEALKMAAATNDDPNNNSDTNINIRGVIMTHDDLIFNLTHLEDVGFPSDDMVLSQALPEVTNEPYLWFNSRSEYTSDPQHGEFLSVQHRPSHLDRTTAEVIYDFNPSKRPRWVHWQKCVRAFANAASSDPRAQRYTHSNGLVPLYAASLGDWQYIPTRLAQLYGEIAEWLVDNEVWLECGTPTIHGYLQAFGDNVTTKFVPTCTPSHDRQQRTMYKDWVPVCTQHEVDFGLYHPVKLRNYPQLNAWDDVFDQITGVGQSDHPTVSNKDASSSMVTVN